MNKIKNVTTALKSPQILYEYSVWILKRVGYGKPTKNIRKRLDVGGFSGFSEYLSVGNCIDDSEFAFLELYPFGQGDIIDVGANLGVLSILLAKRFPEKAVYSVEANPSTTNALQANIELNKCRNVQAIRLALSDQNGSVQFNADPVSRATASISNETSQFSVAVPAQTLDAFVNARGIERIALLKVDVEGYEDLVFDGARETLAAQRVAMIYFEICPALALKAGFDPKSPAQKLVNFGYDLFRLTGYGALAPALIQEIDGLQLTNWVARASSLPCL